MRPGVRHEAKRERGVRASRQKVVCSRQATQINQIPRQATQINHTSLLCEQTRVLKSARRHKSFPWRQRRRGYPGKVVLSIWASCQLVEYRRKSKRIGGFPFLK